MALLLTFCKVCLTNESFYDYFVTNSLKLLQTLSTQETYIKFLKYYEEIDNNTFNFNFVCPLFINTILIKGFVLQLNIF